MLSFFSSFQQPHENIVVDLNSTPIVKDDPKQSKMLIDIKFHNRKTYLAFQEEFIALVKNYYKSKIDDMNIHDDMSNNRIQISEKVVKKSDGFLIDSTPNSKNVKEAESTPTYRSSFGKTILTGIKEDSSKKLTNSPSRNICFNCDKENHSLRDCPEPRNMKKVNKARNEFNKRDLRYHNDNDNEYGHLIPGKISDELKTALGLKSNEIPLHVYRMRLLNYPPGWIEESKIHNSGLSMFVDRNLKQLQPDEDLGETDVSDFKYDLQKIYDFPGFNVSPEKPFADMFRMYEVPPMNLQQSKDEFIQSLGEAVVNGYKKTKLNQSLSFVDTNEDNKTSDGVADMDLEDDADEENPPFPVTSSPEPPIPGDNSMCDSEPMEDGEIKDDSCESLNQNEIVNHESSSSVNITPTMSSQIIISKQNHMKETIIENSENENRDNCAKNSSHQISNGEERTGLVDATIYGCPVLPSFSGCNSLPDGEKFQEGVCDVINFENLSESTGKYEKMKTIIKKVRIFQKDHHKE
ncbi:CLUMA_CG009627, isoform A [Clunio marinus]|uniref:CLUMA_CG009627, isoform A n=1 Tax=Clunio marinus TaxID=568069 RepID=A0A1J1IB44_9DIPT|nr:CLUMA_CG009627, isoform A [Clunio marinus]